MSNTEALRTAADQALDALDEARTYTSNTRSDAWSPRITEECDRAIRLLQSALTEPAASGEPVAWIQPDHLEKAKRAPFLCRVEPTQRFGDFVPLYAAQPAPARVPLTEQQVFDSQEFMHLNGSLLQLAMPQLMLLVRCIERAHGIAAPGAPDAQKETK